MGENAYKYFIVVFTGKDILDDKNKTLHDYIKESPANLQNVIKNCGGRVIAFNNRLRCKDQIEQVRDLLNMILENVQAKEDKCYTNIMYKIEEEIEIVESEKVENEINMLDEIIEKEKMLTELNKLWQTNEEEILEKTRQELEQRVEMLEKTKPQLEQRVNNIGFFNYINMRPMIEVGRMVVRHQIEEICTIL